MKSEIKNNERYDAFVLLQPFGMYCQFSVETSLHVTAINKFTNFIVLHLHIIHIQV